MSVDLTYPHIEKAPHAPACLARTPRVRVAQIVTDYLARGWSPEEMCRQYPHLSLAEVHAAMAYYYDHRDEIEGEIQQELDDLREGEAAGRERSPFWRRIRAEGLR